MNTKLSCELSLVVAVLLAGLVGGCQRRIIERGEYLVTIAACNDCHTPFVMGEQGPQPDMTRMLSGHPSAVAFEIPVLPEDGAWWVGSATNTAFAGPWGISYAANLTPDVNTGLGIWTEQMFVEAIRSGRHMGTSRMIQPPMPWPAYAHMTDDDLAAIYAYLRTIPALENRVSDTLTAEELRARGLTSDRRLRPAS